MRLETLSQITFVARYEVGPRHLASRLYPGLARVLASAHLLAWAEGACIDAIRAALGPVRDTVLGRTMQMHHRAPTRPGEVLALHGWVVRLHEHPRPGVDFCVTARCGERSVAELELGFAIVAPEALARRLHLPATPAASALAA